MSRSYELAAAVSVASVCHERTKGELRCLFARGVREKAAFTAVSVPSTLCWSVTVVYNALDHLPVVYEPAATVGAASVGHERTKGKSRDQTTRDMRGIAEIVEFAYQGAGN